MKKYIETLAAGLIAGAVIMQLINMAVESLIDRQLHMGGEFLLPVLIGLVGYIGWNSADAYFKAVKHNEIYRKGFDDGTKIHNYQIVIPLEGSDERKESA